MKTFCIICLSALLMLNTNAQVINISGPTSFCAGGSVVLTAPLGPTYKWLKNGLQAPGNNTSASYTATTSGSYTVVITNAGIPDTVRPAVIVTVNPKPVALFNFSQTSPCLKDFIQFTDQSAGTGLTYSWDFSDPNSGINNFSTVQNPVHKFIGTNQGGTQTFIVKLKVTNGFGCDSIISDTITFNQPSSKLRGTGFENPNVFKSCTNNTTTFTFINQTTTNNSFYEILWGDNTSYSNATLMSINHTYPVGDYLLKFIVTGVNGCVDTGIYRIFVGSNPAGGLVNPGNTVGCTGKTISFPLSPEVFTNLLSTTIHITINDGTDTIITYPFPQFFIHKFNTTSCGLSPNNSFTLAYEVVNLCRVTPGSIGAIQISDKPVASFTIAPKDTICTNTIVTLASPVQHTIVGNNCVPIKVIWQIYPGTQGVDWIVTSGSIGNDYGLNDPSAWDGGTNNLLIKFLTPGNYQVRFKTAGSCGSDIVLDSLSKNLCVNPIPAGSFTVDSSSGCAPVTVSTFTTVTGTPVCGTIQYKRTIIYTSTGCIPSTPAYQYVSGDSTSKDPVIRFINPGKYLITLTIYSPAAACSSAVITKLITVKGVPNVSLNVPASICQNTCIVPSKTVSCDTASATYAWSFPGGVPSSSNLANPGTVCYPTSGTFTITLTVNGECGPVTVSKSIIIKNIPPPAHARSTNPFFCTGDTLKLFADTIAGATYSWTGPVRIPYMPSTLQNPFIPSITIAGTGYYYVTDSVAGCRSEKDSVFVLVYPRPTKPVPCARELFYCLNSVASPLCANVLAGHTLLWCNNYPLTGCSGTAPVPSTAVAGVFRYYVIQKTDSTGCQSDTSVIHVTVSPGITNNTIKSDQLLCSSGSIPASLNSLSGNVGGGSGSFQYQWQDSAYNGSVWANIQNATNSTYTPGPAIITTKYRRIVKSGGCTDTSNVVVIVVGSSLGNIDITAAQFICAGSVPAMLTGPAGAYTYEWYDSVSNRPWRLIGFSQDYQPPSLDTSTFYRRKVISGGCSAYSLPILITVYKKPDAGTLAPQVTAICAGSNIILTTSSAFTILKWQIGPVPANGIWQDINIVTPSYTFNNVQNSFSVRVIVVTSGYGAGCNLSDTSNIAIINVFPKPVGGHTGPANTVCAGINAGTITLAGYSGQISGWQYSSNNGLQWNAIPSTAPTISFNNLMISSMYRAVVKNGVCDSVFSDTTVILVITNGDVAVAMPDTSLCADSSIVLIGNTPIHGTGRWIKVTGPPNNNVSFLNPFSPVTTVSPLVYGTYVFRWVISFGNCTPSYDDVSINVFPHPDIADAGLNQSTCGSSITLHGNTPVNGNGRWIKLSGGNAIIINPTSPNTIVLNLQPGTYMFKWMISNGPCQSSEDAVQISVYDSLPQANAGNDQYLCNQTFVNLSGNSPLFGTGRWTQIAGPPVYIVDSSLPNTLVTGLLINNVYKFLWTVSGPLGCGISADEIKVTVRPSITIANAGNDTNICNFPFISFIALHANFDPARALERGQWSVVMQPVSGNGTFNNVADPNAVFSFSQAGIYKLVWNILSTEIPASCPPSYDTITINISGKPVADFKIIPDKVCLGQPVTVQNQSLNVNRFQWFWGDGTVSLFKEGQHSYANANTYVIKLIVKNDLIGLGCIDSTVKNVTITALPKTSIKVTPTLFQYQPDYTFTFRDTIQHNSNVSWEWLMGERSMQTRSGREVTYTYGDTGIYKVRLTVKDPVTGCQAFDSVYVSILHVPGYLQVPSGINPGSPIAKLRYFLPLGKGLKEYHLKIFTTWGEKIFETSALNADGSPKEPWDGQNHGRNEWQNPNSGRVLQQDTYYWQIEARYINGTEWRGMIYPGRNPTKSGTITVIK